MKIKYESVKFDQWKLDMIEEVNSIVRRYKAQGYNLSLRQVYYQFVSRDLLPDRWSDKATGSTNNERSYKNLGNLISDGRMGGLIDWNAIEDRTRELTSPSHWDSPASIIEAIAEQYAIDKWSDQKVRIEGWVEKDALEGVVARPCEKLDIAYFSCRGYPSMTALHDAGMRLKKYVQEGQDVVVLDFHDHDPSGIDMTRDATDRLTLFMGPEARGLDVRRMALNMNQIQQYSPPPNPAKITDSRAEAYIQKYGASSWELDALDPTVIDKLITDEVLKIRDDKKYQYKQNQEDNEKDLLQQCSDRWTDVQEFLEE